MGILKILSSHIKYKIIDYLFLAVNIHNIIVQSVHIETSYVLTC